MCFIKIIFFNYQNIFFTLYPNIKQFYLKTLIIKTLDKSVLAKIILKYIFSKTNYVL